MKRLVKRVGVVLLMLGMVPVNSATAQTPDATPVAGDSEWQVADVRDIEVDGDVGALSPDGQWLAGGGPATCSVSGMSRH